MFIVSQFYRDQMSLCVGMAVAVMVMAGLKTIKLDRASQSPLSYSQAEDKIFGHLSKPLPSVLNELYRGSTAAC